jgi:hypothetical protein
MEQVVLIERIRSGDLRCLKCVMSDPDRFQALIGRPFRG